MSSSEALLKSSPPSSSSKPTILQGKALSECSKSRPSGAQTHFILDTPPTNPTTQGKTCTSIFATRKGTLETSAFTKRVS